MADAYNDGLDALVAQYAKETAPPDDGLDALVAQYAKETAAKAPEDSWLKGSGKVAGGVAANTVKAVGGIVGMAETATPASLVASPVYGASMVTKPLTKIEAKGPLDSDTILGLKAMGYTDADIARDHAERGSTPEGAANAFWNKYVAPFSDAARQTAVKMEHGAPDWAKKRIIERMHPILEGTKPEVGEAIREFARPAEEAYKLNVTPGSVKANVFGAGGNVLQMAPWILAAAITKNPGIALEGMSAMAGGLRAAEMQDKGFSPGETMAAAGLESAFEYGTEKLPVEILIKPGISWAKRYAYSQPTEMIGESLATLGQMGLIDKATTDPNLTKKDLANALVDTWVQTLLAGVPFTSVGHYGSRRFVNQTAKAMGTMATPEVYEKLNDEQLANAAGHARQLLDELPKKAPQRATLENAINVFTQVVDSRKTPDKGDDYFIDVQKRLDAGTIPLRDAEAVNDFLSGEKAVLNGKDYGKLEQLVNANRSYPLLLAELHQKEPLRDDVNKEIISLVAKGRISDFKGWTGEPAKEGSIVAGFEGDTLPGRVTMDVAPSVKAANIVAEAPKQTVKQTAPASEVATPAPVTEQGMTPEAPAKKEPWQMTREEFYQKHRSEVKKGNDSLNWARKNMSKEAFKEYAIKEINKEVPFKYATDRYHYANIQQALSEGKPVPPEVLKDYPDLAPQAPVTPATKGTVAKKDKPAFSKTANKKPFYSHLLRTVESKPDVIPGKAQSIVPWLIKNQVKPMEMEEIGLNNWLKENQKDGKVDRQALVDFIKANQVEFQEVVKGRDTSYKLPDDIEVINTSGGWVVQNKNTGHRFNRTPLETEQAAIAWYKERSGGREGPPDTKFSQYILPGGSNYREVLMTLPLSEEQTTAEKMRAEERAIRGEGGRAYRSTNTTAFHGTHWSEPNVIGHLRLQDFTDANGNKVLLVEEVQSDWHQTGKKEGYRGELNTAKEFFGILDADWAKMSQQQKEFYLEEMGSRGGVVPQAPLKENWHEMLMKRALRIAAEGGYDKIAWTTGEQQTERYDLSKRVDKIYYSPYDNGTFEVTATLKNGAEIPGTAGRMDQQKIADTFGKEVADKIAAGVSTGEEDGTLYLSGLDLKVGGKGMKVFYDEKLPAFMNKYTKQWGGKVGMDTIGDNKPVHSVTITPAMQEAVLQGQPLYAKATTSTSVPTLAPPASPRFSPAVVRAHLAPVLRKLPNAGTIEVVRNENDIPVEVAERSGIIRYTQAGETVYGFFDPQTDTTYILSDNISTLQDSRTVLTHELMHRGVFALFSKAERAIIWRDILKEYEGTPVLQSVLDNYGVDVTTEAGREVAGNELIAHLGQRTDRPTLWNKVVRFFRMALKRIGLGNYTESQAEELIRKSWEYAEKGFQKTGAEGNVSFAAAWHGGHDFDRFDSSKIGTGEGAQAYGYGLYFASRREVAEHYKESLSGRQGTKFNVLSEEENKSIPEWVSERIARGGLAEAKDARSDFEDRLDQAKSMIQNSTQPWIYENNASNHIKTLRAIGKLIDSNNFTTLEKKGRLYKVELAPQEDEYLLWDKPLSEQSEKVKAALAGVDKSWRDYISGKEQPDFVSGFVPKTGLEVYKQLANKLGKTKRTSGFGGEFDGSVGQRAASEYLHSLGIRGIKYLDGDSRSKGEGDYNYVIFSDKDVEITAKFLKHKPLPSQTKDDTITPMSSKKGPGDTTKTSPEAKPEGGKELWEMTQAEYVSQHHDNPKAWMDHFYAVYSALERGEWIPDEVMDQYQNLSGMRFKRSWQMSSDEWGAQAKGIPILSNDVEFYRNNPEYIERLIEQQKEKDKIVGLRGIYKKELGKKKLQNSWDNPEDRPKTELPGSSTMDAMGSVPVAINLVQKHGDQDFIAVVSGDPIDRNVIPSEHGEIVIGQPTVIAYIPRNTHKGIVQRAIAENMPVPIDVRAEYPDLPNPSRSPGQGEPVASKQSDDIRFMKQKKTYGAEPSVSHPDPTDPKTWDIPFKEHVAATMKAIWSSRKLPQGGLLERIMGSPEWWQDPVLNELYRIHAETRDESARKHLIDMNEIDGKTVSDVEAALRKKNPEGYELYQRFMEEGDTTYVRDTSKLADPKVSEDEKARIVAEQQADFEKHMRKNGATDDVVDVWRLARKSLDKGFDKMTAEMRKIEDMLKEAGEDAKVDELQKALAQMNRWRGFYAPRIRPEGNWKITGYRRKQGKPPVVRFLLADDEGTKSERSIQVFDPATIVKDSFRTVKATGNSLNLPSTEGVSYIMGRRADTGEQVIQAIGFKKNTFTPDQARKWWKENERIIINSQTKEFYSTTGSRRQMILAKNKMAQEGWAMGEIKEIEKVPEDVYLGIKQADLSAALRVIIEKAGTTDQAKEQAALAAKLNYDLIQEASDFLKSRGFRSSMIHRKEGPAIKGYITDPMERRIMYVTRTSYGLAKAEAAKLSVTALMGTYNKETKQNEGGLHPARDARKFTLATKFLDEMLRNTDTIDRYIGIAKSVATFKFLGFNPRSVAVNVTALATTAPVAIRQYVGEAKVSLPRVMAALTKASGEYGAYMAGKRSRFTEDERKLLDDMKKKGYDEPQYTRDVAGVLQTTPGKAWSNVMTMAMWMFGKSEQWIRGTTMLAGYRMGKHVGMTHEEAEKAAKTASDKAHGNYTRAARPEVTWGTGIGRIGTLMYSYSKFGHNYLQMLYDLGVRRHDIQGFLYGLLSPLVIGGMMAFPFRDILFGIVKAIFRLFGDRRDPEKLVWDTVRDMAGDTAEKGLRHGVVGLAGWDITSSLSVTAQTPRGLVDLLGAPGQAVVSMAEGGGYIMKGQWGKAGEKVLPSLGKNILQTVRESSEGVTTKYGNTVFDKDGAPLKLSGWQAVSRALGARSTDQAVLTERVQEAKREEKSFAEWKDAIYQRYKDYVRSPDDAVGEAILKEIEAYNGSIVAHELYTVPPITAESLDRVMENVFVPTKKEYLRVR